MITHGTQLLNPIISPKKNRMDITKSPPNTLGNQFSTMLNTPPDIRTCSNFTHSRIKDRDLREVLTLKQLAPNTLVLLQDPSAKLCKESLVLQLRLLDTKAPSTFL
ncbi:hypothetical protein ACOSQ2_016520 [Xanthoceras sorbifolium]